MKYWRGIVGVIVVFFLGIILGVIVSHIVCDNKMHKFMVGGPPDDMHNMIIKQMTRELELDTKQTEQMQLIMQDMHKEMKAFHEQFFPQIKKIVDEADNKTLSILRPEQKEKFQDMINKRKEREERMWRR
ncbi:MAG: hypothetical protein L3V56_04690 [Candidatus Magnetoovum sp. WYHC-5]|nr:hypothetical protein [Candidatus Magnetoovum sp. WYHC-5]